MPTIGHLPEPDEIISLIYQGPLEPTPWQSFLSCLRTRMDCDVAAISLGLRRLGHRPINVWDGKDFANEKNFNLSAESIEKIGRLAPLDNALSSPGDIFTLDDIISDKDLMQNEYYNSLMRPIGMRYQLAMRFSEPSGWKSNVGLMNGPDKGNFGDDEKAYFIAFRPHLERALELYARIKHNESEKLIFEEALDRLTIGTFILDGNGKVINTNKTGQGVVGDSQIISVTGCRLVLARPQSNARLQRVIKAALAWREMEHAEAFVEALQAEGDDGANLGILVRTVPPGDKYHNEVSPSIIIYVNMSGRSRAAPERFVAQLFGLTPSEAELATLLANGYTLIEAAEKLGITDQSVRTYSKRLFSKTGVGRQADLVRLILTSVALLA